MPNLHKVNDGLFRSAQPTAEGMKALQAMGIRTVLNLRQYHTDRNELVGTDLLSETMPLPTWSLKEIDAVRFLRIATDPQKLPLLVHCNHGTDRTGALVAVYRIAVQGWTKQEAIKEMIDGGYGFHHVWVNLKPWIEELDIERVRLEAGIPTVPPITACCKDSCLNCI